MPRIDLAGTEIAFELIGPPGAPCVAITPGGRFGMDSPGIRPMAEALAAGGRRALIWDRPTAAPPASASMATANPTCRAAC